MNRHHVALATTFLTVALAIRPAVAEPIMITGGSVQLNGFSGTVTLVGERDFSLAAVIGVSDGFFGPWLQCNLGPACVPGSELDLSARWTGTSLHGATATLDGETFTGAGALQSKAQVSLRPIGSVIAPAFDANTALVVAPFLLEGLFSYSNATGALITESLFGQGTVSLSLRSFFRTDAGLPLAWAYTAAQYDFEPTPEPATILLTGAGIAALLRRRLRRRRCRR
jgi:hypothetical protein